MESKNNAKTAKVSTPRLRYISRVSAWLLLVTVVILVVSGWGITQTGVIYKFTFGLIDRRLADSIHRATNLPLAIFFLLHVLTNIKLSITTQHRLSTWLLNSVLIVVGGCILGIVIYLEYFRVGG
jgi:cytochrome b subunit of formate dehydrogenase